MAYQNMGKEDLGRELASVTAWISHHKRRTDEETEAGKEDHAKTHRDMLVMYGREADELERLLGLEKGLR